MKNTPIERHLIDETINEFQIVDFSKATIREVKAIASKAEAASGVEFIKITGALVQLVRIHACHAWGHGFESRTHRFSRKQN